ncbi:hypothetical protein [Methylobacterium marchantiae]|uniref:Uncharacterized protein n=1 Tax=Methylobacterium marchantiae TaxID=600331 RepID=A0ABW3WXF7_9HYPH
MRDAILKMMGTTEDELAGPPAEKQQGIEVAIKEKLVGALADVNI